MGVWHNARLARRDAGDEVKRLKNDSGKDLVVLGSGALISSLTKLGLVDEYQLILQPVILGEGIPESQNIDRRMKLKLVKSRQLREGQIILYYQMADYRLRRLSSAPKSLISRSFSLFD